MIKHSPEENTRTENAKSKLTREMPYGGRSGAPLDSLPGAQVRAEAAEASEH